MGNKFSKNKNKDKTENKPSTTTPATEEKKEDPQKSKHDEAVKYGLSVMRQGFVKVDHFENIYRLTPKYEGAPNLRQVSGFEIYGSGQPNKSSIISLLNLLFSDENKSSINKCLWINMRSEPVIYVKDISLGPRDPKHPSENIDFGEEGIITIDDLNLFNAELEKVVEKNIKDNNGVFKYHKDTYAPLPADRKDIELEDKCGNISEEVYGLQSLYKSLKENNKLNVELERITVLDEKAPDPADIVKIVNVINKEADDKTAIIFNCQMGKGRTTEGMIMACLIKLIQAEKDKGDDNGDEKVYIGDGKWPINVPDKSEEEESFNKKLAKKKEEAPDAAASDEEKGDGKLSGDDMRKGNFTLIEKLVGILCDEYKLDGKKIKQETDDIINRCQHLTNMRECIYLAKRRYIAESRDNLKGYWVKMSKQFLQRYYVLIVFNAYLNDVILKQNKTTNDINYIQWINDKKLINENLGTLKDGALSKFNWD